MRTVGSGESKEQQFSEQVDQVRRYSELPVGEASTLAKSVLVGEIPTELAAGDKFSVKMAIQSARGKPLQRRRIRESR